MLRDVYNNGTVNKEQSLERLDNGDPSVGNEELLARCANGDQQAMRFLFYRHERPVYGFLYRMLSNREDAEDALADVFVKVWKSAAGFKGKSSFTTWLYRIAGNTARDVLRSRKTRRELPLEDFVANESELLKGSAGHFENPEEVLLKAAGNAVLSAGMAQLSDEDRLLITLYHIKEYSYEEIAGITGIAPGHLKVKVFRARQKLKKLCMAIEDEEENGLRNSTTESAGLQPPTTKRL